MRIFVTGGTGFIGKALIRSLVKRGHRLLILTRSPRKSEAQEASYIQGNLQSLQDIEPMVKNFRPEILLHLAWEGLPDYSLDTSRKNLEYSLNVFSLAVKAGCTCILSTGSCWEYAGRQGRLPEEGLLESGAIFPATKNAIRFIGEAIAQENGLRFYWLRLFFVYGLGQRQTSLIPHIIKSVRQNRLPQIQSPHNRHDFIFVEDAVRAIGDVLEQQPRNTVYNVGSGYATAVENIVEIVYDMMKKKIDKSNFLTQQCCITQNFWADISRIQRDVGWRPEYNIKSGIQTIINGLAQERI